MIGQLCGAMCEDKCALEEHQPRVWPCRWSVGVNSNCQLIFWMAEFPLARLLCPEDYSTSSINSGTHRYTDNTVNRPNLWLRFEKKKIIVLVGIGESSTDAVNEPLCETAITCKYWNINEVINFSHSQLLFVISKNTQPGLWFRNKTLGVCQYSRSIGLSILYLLFAHSSSNKGTGFETSLFSFCCSLTRLRACASSWATKCKWKNLTQIQKNFQPLKHAF